MHLLLYVGPMSLVAGVIFFVSGNIEAGRLGVFAWMGFTFFAPFVVKPRTAPEMIMTAGNQLLFALGVLYGIVVYWV